MHQPKVGVDAVHPVQATRLRRSQLGPPVWTGLRWWFLMVSASRIGSWRLGMMLYRWSDNQGARCGLVMVRCVPGVEIRKRVVTGLGHALRPPAGDVGRGARIGCRRPLPALHPNGAALVSGDATRITAVSVPSGIGRPVRIAAEYGCLHHERIHHAGRHRRYLRKWIRNRGPRASGAVASRPCCTSSSTVG